VGGEEDGCAKCQYAWRLSYLDLRAVRIWAGVRRAGLRKAMPGADAGPAAPRSGAALIQVRLNSATQSGLGLDSV